VIYDVTSAADDGGAHELRWAIQQHNLNADPGDQITFHIGTGNATIAPVGSALPAITTQVLIDGTTQPGYNNSPLIQLDGTNLTNGQIAGNGLDLQAGGCTIKGLIISNFWSDGILLETTSSFNLIKNCWIGTDITGNGAGGNRSVGIRILSSKNTIGGAGTSACVISANSGPGVLINGMSGSTFAQNNIITGDYIGTNKTGTQALGNGGDGVLIEAGANNNNIGGAGGLDSPNNVISGNTGNGVVIEDDTSINNYVASNRIGTNKAGTAKIPNGGDGVLIGSANNNTIGSTGSDGNFISGNTGYGVEIAYDPDALMPTSSANNTVAGNYIGMQADGQTTLANGSGGVYLRDGSKSNVIGGTPAGVGATKAGNLISGNKQAGIYLNGAINNSILGNYVGTDKDGMLSGRGNDVSGILLKSHSDNNTIGAAGTRPSNVISGNGFGNTNGAQGQGIDIDSSQSNVVAGNYIGTDKNGTGRLGNRSDGMYIGNSSGFNTIGGGMANAGNISSANGAGAPPNNVGWGVDVAGINNSFQFNYFGLDANGAQLPNSSGGRKDIGTNNTWGNGRVDNNQYQLGGSPRRLNPELINPFKDLNGLLKTGNSSRETSGTLLLASNPSRPSPSMASGRSLISTVNFPERSGENGTVEFIFIEGFWYEPEPLGCFVTGPQSSDQMAPL
jgi:hypothetical protein